ncbi:MAG: hypothetical protein ACRCUE_01150 [Bosea sp. (in: a-proteobacteria)]
MDRRTLILALGASVAATQATWAQTPAVQGDPVAMIRAIMAGYVADKATDAPYTPAVANRLKTAELGYDVILDAQDFQVTKVQVAGLSAAADRAEVEARFENMGEPRQVKFDFRVVDGRWMIANVRDQKGFDLRRTLKLAPLT